MAEETKERLACGPILKEKSPLFAALSEDEVFEVLSRCTQREFVAGDTILQEGDPGSTMFVIVEGEVEYRKGNRAVGIDTVGGFFGEIALLSKEPAKRNATVVAKTKCTLIEIYRPEFRDMLKKYPDVSMLTISTLVGRISAAKPAPMLKSATAVTLLALLTALLVKFLSKHLPADMANETVTYVIANMEAYLVPLLAGIGLIARQVEAKVTSNKLMAGSR